MQTHVDHEAHLRGELSGTKAADKGLSAGVLRRLATHVSGIVIGVVADLVVERVWPLAPAEPHTGGGATGVALEELCACVQLVVDEEGVSVAKRLQAAWAREERSAARVFSLHVQGQASHVDEGFLAHPTRGPSGCGLLGCGRVSWREVVLLAELESAHLSASLGLMGAGTPFVTGASNDFVCFVLCSRLPAVSFRSGGIRLGGFQCGPWGIIVRLAAGTQKMQ